MLTIIYEALKETGIMLLLSGILTLFFGLWLGILLFTSKHKHFFANNFFHVILQWPCTFLNATPYLVIAIAFWPATKWLTGHGVTGNLAAVIPLSIAAIPLFATAIQTALTKLPAELTTTAQALGGTAWQALWQMYLPEIFPNLIKDFTKILKNLLGYSTISGIFGAGGLGYLLLQKGYYSFDLLYISICALLLVILYQLVQYLGILISGEVTA